MFYPIFLFHKGLGTVMFNNPLLKSQYIWIDSRLHSFNVFTRVSEKSCIFWWIESNQIYTEISFESQKTHKLNQFYSNLFRKWSVEKF